MKVVELPLTGLLDVSRGLRNLADGIDKGEYGDVVNIAWVVDSEYRSVECGLLGKCANPDAVFVTLCEAAKMYAIKRMGK